MPETSSNSALSTHGTFYVVPTPIGNLQDITLRAISILQTVDLILTEDTRTSAVLLKHFDIHTPTKSYHKFNEKEMTPKIIQKLNSGQNIALISDAGTPLISDPGAVLVQELHQNGITPVPLPGACAVTTFLSAIDNPSNTFEFVGFLPTKNKDRAQIFEKIKDHTIVFYESPNRIVKTLQELAEQLPDSQVAIGRELTKIHEEIKQGAIQEILEYYLNKPPKGEMVVAVLKTPTPAAMPLDKHIITLVEQGYGAKDISKILSTIFETNKKEIYQKALHYINT